MSVEAIQWALYLPHKNPTHKVVLIALANHADPDGGQCYPSIPRLETYTGLHRASVIRAIQQMEELGIISAEHEQGKRTRYHLNMDAKLVAEGDQSQPATSRTVRPNQSQRATRTSRTVRPKPSLTVIQPSIDIYATDFAAFYSAYPRKVGPADAEKAYRAARKKASHEVIMEGLARYADAIRDNDTPQHFIKHPGPWLRAARWADEPQVHRPVKSGFGEIFNDLRNRGVME